MFTIIILFDDANTIAINNSLLPIHYDDTPRQNCVKIMHMGNVFGICYAFTDKGMENGFYIPIIFRVKSDLMIVRRLPNRLLYYDVALRKKYKRVYINTYIIPLANNITLLFRFNLRFAD